MSLNRYSYFLEHFAGQLPVGESFDLIERKLNICGRACRLYFVDGLTDGEKGQLLLNFLLAVPDNEMRDVETTEEFIEKLFPFFDCKGESDIAMAVKHLYSGLTVIAADGLDQLIICDARVYPQRSVEEPEKEKTLRGAKDGFTENFMDSVALIRRRIRDNRLIFKIHTVGEKSKTDVAVCYMKGSCDMPLLKKIEEALSSIQTDNISVSDQSILEQLRFRLGRGRHKGTLNPFPKVRYTQRPDVVCAHLAEGKIAIIVDNSPTVLLLPVGIFDFTQDTDDYYFPLITGNYLRFLRMMNMVVILVVSPIYLLIVEGYIPPPFNMEFFGPENAYAIPIFWQFILLELAIDGLKLASLNTPESLGMSLSVIGALILGQFSIDSGWFIPQTILVMAVVALASFTQPSIELAYGIKMLRVIMLTASYLLGLWGFAGGLVLGFTVIALTKTISGHSYLYPLIPFHWKSLKKLLFRTAR